MLQTNIEVLAFFRYKLISGFAGSYSYYIFLPFEETVLFSVIIPIYILTNSAQVFSLFSSSTLLISCVLRAAILRGGLPRWYSCKEFTSNSGGTRDTVLICGLGRSTGVGNRNLLWNSCLIDSMDRTWQATVHGVT